MSFAIFTDTSANLPTPWLRAEGIGVLPFHYSYNNRDYACLDTEAFDDAAYYAAIGKGVKVSTAQVTPQQYMDAFEPVLAAGRDLLFVGMSSGISGSFFSAESAAEELRGRYPERVLRLVDTLGASLGEGLLVMRAVEYQKKGMSLEQTADMLMVDRHFMMQIFTVDDLMHLRRTGRLSGGGAVIGTLLGIKPLLFGNPEGKIITLSKARGRKAALHEIAARYDAMVGSAAGQTVGIAQAGCPEDAALLSELLRKNHPPREILTVKYEPVTGSHVGPGALALFFFSSRKRS